MSNLKIEDLAYVRFRAPDLAEMRAFLEDFGLFVVETTEDRLVMRGASSSPVVHVTERGAAGFSSIEIARMSLSNSTTP